MNAAATPKPAIARLPESEKVRGAKVIGAALDGMDRTTVTRRAKAGRLIVILDGEVKAVVYKDHKGYFAPKHLLEAWLEQQVHPVGGANDTAPATG